MPTDKRRHPFIECQLAKEDTESVLTASLSTGLGSCVAHTYSSVETKTRSTNITYQEALRWDEAAKGQAPKSNSGL